MLQERQGFNKTIIDVIKAWRIANKVKQSVMADALCMTECNYCKIEKHYKEITIGQLTLIAKVLDTTAYKIIGLAESLTVFDNQNVSLQDLIIHLHTLGNHNFANDYQGADIMLILSKIKVLSERKSPNALIPLNEQV